MRMAKRIHRNSSQRIEVTLAFYIPDMNTFTPFQYDRKRMIIMGTETILAFNSEIGQRLCL